MGAATAIDETPVLIVLCTNYDLVCWLPTDHPADRTGWALQ
jgi:hypothetical protein